MSQTNALIGSGWDGADDGVQKRGGDEAEARRRQTALLKLYDQFPKNMPYAALLETTADDAVASSQKVSDARRVGGPDCEDAAGGEPCPG